MIVRCIAWVLLLAFGFFVYQFSTSFKNPWASVSASPVLSMLPVAHDGCGKDCKK